MTVALRGSDASAVSLTTKASVALCRAIEAVFGISDTGIKWVNDVYVGGKKVAGILAESVASGTGSNTVILGIGVNISTENFPAEISKIAASLGVKGERRGELCGAICRELFALIASESGEYMDEYRRRSIVIGREVTYFVSGEERIGYVDAILDSGALEVTTASGEREILNSGEITLRVRK
jgi:BirA family biotin operon repressor/biotin-[acetyl-CoA-carboxylase] ligase